MPPPRRLRRRARGGGAADERPVLVREGRRPQSGDEPVSGCPGRAIARGKPHRSGRDAGGMPGVGEGVHVRREIRLNWDQIGEWQEGC
jgi:hypothetical protein